VLPRPSRSAPIAATRLASSLSSPESLRELVQNLREGVYITTGEGEIVDANPAMLEMFGVRSMKELEHSRVQQWIDPLQRAREHAILEKHGVVRDYEFAFRRPSGEVRTVIDTAFRRRDRVTGRTLYYGILIDITERKRLERQLVDAGLRDPLTGCYNRRYLRRFEAEQGSRGWGCIVIDVDHFKDYNDRYGHQRGDKVLVRMARVLGAVCRSEDAVVRLGGDEFMILLARGGDAAVSRVVRRLAESAGQRGLVPFSMGHASRWRGERLQHTISRADRRLIAVRVATRSDEREQRRADAPLAPAARRTLLEVRSGRSRRHTAIRVRAAGRVTRRRGRAARRR
jgi:diguanylate cyclase (GGDEF)-like protein/PAS domain S-box-containing protein